MAVGELEDVTVVSGEDETVVASEAVTAVAEPETVAEPVADVADGPGETTAVTVTGVPLGSGEPRGGRRIRRRRHRGKPEADGPDSSGPRRAPVAPRAGAHPSRPGATLGA